MSQAARDIVKLLRQAEAKGCHVANGGKHYKVTLPDGSLVVVSRTPSKPMVLKRIRKQLGL